MTTTDPKDLTKDDCPATMRDTDPQIDAGSYWDEALGRRVGPGDPDWDPERGKEKGDASRNVGQEVPK
jgi:hypothetical protein